MRVSALKKLGMVRRHDHFFIKILYVAIAFFRYIFHHFSAYVFDNILLTIHNRMFRVGAKT